MEKIVEKGCTLLEGRVIVDTGNDNCGLQNLNTTIFVSGAAILPKIFAPSAFTPISPVRKQLINADQPYWCTAPCPGNY
jgi:hypothetical protein